MKSSQSLTKCSVHICRQPSSLSCPKVQVIDVHTPPTPPTSSALGIATFVSSTLLLLSSIDSLPPLLSVQPSIVHDHIAQFPDRSTPDLHRESIQLSLPAQRRTRFPGTIRFGLPDYTFCIELTTCEPTDLCQIPSTLLKIILDEIPDDRPISFRILHVQVLTHQSPMNTCRNVSPSSLSCSSFQVGTGDQCQGRKKQN
ncbi:hypothetical protein BCR39DRAFT_71375 [Naematelia encephala]|uniref:Uncharacterized protein n=1 Tax=Naematelia encephala TaxID=71784 RepID=A0A1Y2BAW5_9TREE|nr:hypothetical protein BCR39DRAFT_71375 [Naematelia encephala]